MNFIKWLISKLLGSHIRRFLCSISLCILSGILLLASSTISNVYSKDISHNIIIQLGPNEIIRGPDTITDNPFNTLTGITSLHGYVGNAVTFGYIGGSLETLQPINNEVLQSGTDFDSCGAWLNSVWQDGDVIRGWYHAETECAFPETRKSVAYAESYDGGNTFVKPNYPNNQVITASPIYTNHNNDDEGDHRVIRIGNYLYMYFLSNHRPSWQIYLARSHISDKGLPGTWQKYHNGAFTQPGLGGEASPIASWTNLATSWVSYNTYLSSYIGFSGVWDKESNRQQGFGLSTSVDGLNNWTAIRNTVTGQPYLLLSYEGSWDRYVNNGDLIAYPSFISIYGSSDRVNDVFWLYYMYLNPGEGFDRRYLIRRKVHIKYTDSSSPLDLVPRIALSEYRNLNDRWFTTTNTNPQYTRIKTIGYLFTDKTPHSVPLYDCYVESQNDHMLVPNDKTCGGGNVRYLHRIGWISTVPFHNSIQIYRCWDSSTTNHFVSADPNCEGKETEWSLGYIAKMPPLPQNQFIALSNYFNPGQKDNWSTTIKPPQEYEFKFRFGYLFTDRQANSLPVYDCYIPSWKDHMLVINDQSCGGAQNLGLIGYISSVQLHDSRPIYRCFDEQATNHFMSLNYECNGKKFEWLAGYIITNPDIGKLPIYLPIIYSQR